MNTQQQATAPLVTELLAFGVLDCDARILGQHYQGEQDFLGGLEVIAESYFANQQPAHAPTGQPWAGIYSTIAANGSSPRMAIENAVAGLDPATLQLPLFDAMAKAWAKAQSAAAAPAKKPSEPYEIHRGRLVYLAQHTPRGGKPVVTREVIADFAAHIATEVTTEEGARFYQLQGRAIRGGDFQTEISADDFADDRKLKAALDAAAGAQDPVRAGMGKHLGPAIKLLSNQVNRCRRYHRTGWTDAGRFLIPGREMPGVDVHLHHKLPYSVAGDSDPRLALEAMEALLVAMTPERGAPILAFVFQGPMAALAGWRNERYGLFISGRTGSLKTSFAQAALSMWGAGFAQDHLLIKWGEGATRNAIMAMAAQAHDLPLLIDNFKPSTGGGTRDFVNLAHNILEGGEKDRLNRAAQLKETRPVFCWPLVTGEDLPDQDPATLARILVVPFDWQRGQANAALAEAQRKAAYLPALGAAWLDWLEDPLEGGRAAERAGHDFVISREVWADKLRKAHPNAANVLRVASNLASNELTWSTLGQHPMIGPLVQRFDAAHAAGLEMIAGAMGACTTETLEALRFVQTLRELLQSGRVTLLSNTGQPQPMGLDPERDRFVGWQDGNGGAYILPSTARAKVEALAGKAALGFLSERALYSQLDALGLIASHAQDRPTKVVRTGGGPVRVLHLAAAALEEP